MCIDNLRYAICNINSLRGGIKAIGAVTGAFAFGKIGAQFGLQGACIGGLVGAGVGAYGFYRSYYSIQWVVALKGFGNTFTGCMKGCGLDCKSGGNCLIDRAFQLVVAEDWKK